MRIWRFGIRSSQMRPVAFGSVATGVDALAGDGGRRDLLGRIGSFLLRNQLDFSARNLVISHAPFRADMLDWAAASPDANSSD